MFKELIKKSPYFIQQPIRNLRGIIPYEKRLGKEFEDTYCFLNKSQYLSKEQHEEYQVDQLKKLLIHSYNNVTYYHKLFDNCGFDANRFKYLDEMSRIPFLTKDLIIDNLEELKAKNFDKKQFIYNSTGGTTGKQMKFFVQKNFSESREWAFVMSQWSRIGFDYSTSKRVILRNEVLPKGRLWLWDNYRRSLVIDTYHLTDDNIKKIIDKLNEVKIEYIHTYPSAIIIICDFIKRTGYKLNYDLKGVLVTSENIYAGQREFIESILNTRVFSFYGHSEKCIFAGECEKSNKYHIYTEYGYAELIDQCGKVINEPELRGELVGTSFNNYVMPFIRYRTADYASYSIEEQCECGRNYKILEAVEGRWLQEMIITSKGNKISITAINMHSDVFDNVKNFQFYQEEKGVCYINIVKNPNYNILDERNIIKELSKKLGEDVILKINYVNEIERTARGKYRYLIQKLN